MVDLLIEEIHEYLTEMWVRMHAPWLLPSRRDRSLRWLRKSLTEWGATDCNSKGEWR